MLTRGVSPTSETMIFKKNMNLMDSTPQNVAEAKSLHRSKERQGKFTDQEIFSGCKFKEASPGQEVSELQMIGNRESV